MNNRNEDKSNGLTTLRYMLDTEKELASKLIHAGLLNDVCKCMEMYRLKFLTNDILESIEQANQPREGE